MIHVLCIHIQVVASQPVATCAMTVIDAKPANHLAMLIFNLVCCCFVFGIIALVHSFQVSSDPDLMIMQLDIIKGEQKSLALLPQVESAWDSGDRLGAKRASDTARTRNLAGIIIGTVAWAIVAVTVPCGAASYHSCCSSFSCNFRVR